MYISRISIENFRNFYELDTKLARDAVIVGENAIGKSNLIHGLRLILDPSLPDSLRQLRPEDFWDGISRPIDDNERIEISIELADFENDSTQVAALADFLVQAVPMVARLTYEFFAEKSRGRAQWRYRVFGGTDTDNILSNETRRRIALEWIPALRDAEADLANWRRSPARSALSRAAEEIEPDRKLEIAKRVNRATNKLRQLKPIARVEKQITDRLASLVGASQSKGISLGFESQDADRLIRSLRLMVDGGVRPVGEASLGLANSLFLTLRILEIETLARAHDRDQTFLAIEEPEAHLHPHLQRTVFKSLLHPRRHLSKRKRARSRRTSLILTTHSPHIASVTPVRSIVVLRTKNGATVARSTAGLALSRRDREDIERYLDVTRAELLFARRVLLVEGDAELFVVPQIATQLGLDLDELGVSVCSVSGTNFAPYVKLLRSLTPPLQSRLTATPARAKPHSGKCVQQSSKLCSNALGLPAIGGECLLERKRWSPTSLLPDGMQKSHNR